MTEDQLKKIRQSSEVQDLLKRAIKNKDKIVDSESHSDSYKMDAVKLNNLARTIRLNKDNARETALLDLVRNTKKYDDVTINSIEEKIHLELGVKKSTLFNRIDKLLRYSLNISAFKNGNRYKKIPYKYQGLVYKLLVEIINDKSDIAKICSSPKEPSFDDLYKLYQHVFDIINTFKETGKQECTYNDKYLFSEYFFTSDDADLVMQLSYIEKLNYDNTYKEALQTVFIAMSDLNNTEVIAAARELNIDNELQDFIEGVLIDCNQDPELSNKRKELSPLFFDDNEFLEIVGNIAGGYFYTISQDLTKEIKDCMDIMFFCDHKNIQIMYESLFNLINRSKDYARAAKEKIDNYIQRYEREYEGYNSDEKQKFREEIKILKYEINKSEIAKQVFKECGGNEKLKI